MQHVGYKLIDCNGSVLFQWGGVSGECPDMPARIDTPAGNHIHGAELDTDYDGVRLVKWMASTDAAPQAMPAAGTFVFGGVAYNLPDLQLLSLNVALASNAIQHGIQANDYRWCDPARDFTVQAADGSQVSMDAPTLIQFALAVRKL